MKTAIIITIAAIGWLAGCTIERTVEMPETVAPATQPPATATPQTVPPASSYADEDLFVEAIHTVHQGPVYVSDRELIETGWIVCDAAASGVTAQEMVAMAENAATDDDTFMLLMEVTMGALMFLCPEYEYIIDQITTI